MLTSQVNVWVTFSQHLYIVIIKARGSLLPGDDTIRLVTKGAEGRQILIFRWVGVRMVIVNRRDEAEPWLEIQEVSIKLVTLVNKKLTSWVKLATWSKAQG